MKKLIIVLLCIPFVVLAAIEEDPLDLGNVIIEGKTISLTDSVESIRNFDKFYALASIEDFQYTAYFSPIVVRSPLPYDDKNNFVVQFKGGLDKFTSINGAVSADNIYNFSASFYNHERDDVWIERTYSLQWQPRIKDHDMIFDLTNFKFTSALGETEIMSGLISYKNKDLRFKGISDLNAQVNFQAEYHDLTQVEETAKDVDLISKLAIFKNNYNASLSVNFLQQRIYGYSTFGLANLPFFNKLGLWIGYDKDNIYPSIQLISKLNIAKDLNLIIENDPEISTRSRVDCFNDNLLHSILAGKFQTKKMVNSYLTIRSDHFTPMSFFYNFQLDRDHSMYSDVDNDGLYELERVDCLIHKLGWKFVYEIDKIVLTENMEYKFSDEQLYFDPLFISSTTCKYEQRSYNIGLTVNAYSGGEDDDGDDLETAVLVDVNADYKLRKNISIIAEVKNLLDQDYNRYNNYITDELRLTIGFKMLF